MDDYRTVTVFDWFGDQMEIRTGGKKDFARITIIQDGYRLKFFADNEEQSCIIEELVKANIDCKDLALKRISYEITTVRAQFERLIESHKLLKEENERLNKLLYAR